MLPRHAYLSATMLALAATMSEEDSPVVPPPEPSDEPSAPALTGIASIDAALSGGVPAGSLNFMIGGGPVNGKTMWAAAQTRRVPVLPTDHDAQASFAAAQAADRTTSITWDRRAVRPEQRANKKARAKRKAKKGWA